MFYSIPFVRPRERTCGACACGCVCLRVGVLFYPLQFVFCSCDNLALSSFPIVSFKNAGHLQIKLYLQFANLTAPREEEEEAKRLLRKKKKRWVASSVQEAARRRCSRGPLDQAELLLQVRAGQRAFPLLGRDIFFKRVVIQLLLGVLRNLRAFCARHSRPSSKSRLRVVGQYVCWKRTVANLFQNVSLIEGTTVFETF